MKMSYMVGYGGQYPTQVHHRSASIPWDSQPYLCTDGKKWLRSKDPNPNILVGAMVAGPDLSDKFLDQRDKPWFTQPSISSNAGLVAALIALHDSPPTPSPSSGTNLGIDLLGLFRNIKLSPPAPWTILFIWLYKNLFIFWLFHMGMEPYYPCVQHYLR